MRANGMSRTQRSSKDLIKEIGVLKSQLKKLSSAMEADATDGVNGAVSAIQLKSRAAVDDAIEAATSFIGNGGLGDRKGTGNARCRSRHPDQDGQGTADRDPGGGGRYRLPRGVALSPVLRRR
jgi:hypothetical protein